MKKLFTTGLIFVLLFSLSLAQTPQKQQPQEPAAEDVVRISTSLVQTDVVVTDKSDQVIPDLSSA